METLTGCPASKILGADTDSIVKKIVPLSGYEAYGSLGYFTRRDGQKIYIDKSFVEIQYNSKPAQLFSIRDITDKINAIRDKAKLKNELEKAKKMEAFGIHISKIVMNLITNAVEAAGKRGRIIVETSEEDLLNQKIKGYEKKLNGRVIKFCVKNTGESISEKDMDHIFEPFYSKKVLGRSGTGLGLSIVWNAVHDHNGYIEVSSRENNTCFTLYFPMIESNDTTIAVPVTMYTLEDYSGHGEKILVVDDMPNQRKIAMNMLKRLGYRVHAVYSGEEALEYVQKNPIDLAVLDMVMEPGLNGLETYKELVLIDPKIKAIITSGYQKSKDVEQSQKLGAGRFVKKPYSLEKLGLALKTEFSDGKILL